MKSKVVISKVVAVLAIGLLLLPGCKDPKAAIQISSAVIGLLTTTTVAMKKVEAANLDVEAKRLKVEGLKKNGEKVAITQDLSDSQLKQIRDTGKAEIKLEDNSTATVEVTIGRSQTATSSELEKIKSRLEKSLVDFKNKDLQVSGKTTRAWIQQTSRPEDSGAASRIEWNDGVVSTILFLENSNVRIWVKGVEYSGKWSWSPSGDLQVQTDQGSYYGFSS